MGRNRKPRKAYKPRPIDLDPVDMVKSGVAKLTLAQRLAFERDARTAFAGLRSATGGLHAWETVADAMNVSELLAANICSDRLPEFFAAQDALHELHSRVQAGGSWTMRAAEITALDFAVDLHVIQLQFCSQREMDDAIKTVKRKMQQALKGNAPRSARICVGALGAAA